MKTKTIISVLFACMVVCGHTQAQDDLPYRPFQAFKKDTIQYLDYNFMLRNDQYVGKTVGELLKDLELPVVYASDFFMVLDEGIYGMNLVIRLNRDNEWDNSKDYFIGIALKYPLKGKDYSIAIRSDERNKNMNDPVYWTPQLQEVLKDFQLVRIFTNDKLFEERRILRENTTWENIEKVKKIYDSERERWRKIIQAEKQGMKR